MTTQTPDPIKAFRSHPSKWKEFSFVYPVISRRAGGISIGINLNPDRKCNFDCVYCQIERDEPFVSEDVNFLKVEHELRSLLKFYLDGHLQKEEPFVSAPAHLLELKDIAFSGEGEPTLFGPFEAMMELVAHLKAKLLSRSVKLILITNGSGLGRASVQRGLDILWSNQGEVWVKLDAGSEEYYERINRSKVPLKYVLNNIEVVSRTKPIVIQTMITRIHGQKPDEVEISMYIARLKELLNKKCLIKEVHLYTLARSPTETYVEGVDPEELAKVARHVHEATGLVTKSYYDDKLTICS